MILVGLFGLLALADAANTILAVGAIIGGIAYAAGQLIASRKRGQSDAMRIAVEEVGAIKIRADRLERDVVALEAEVHALKKENATLRELLTTRNDLDQRLIAAVEEAVSKQTRRLVDVLREGRKET